MKYKILAVYIFHKNVFVILFLPIDAYVCVHTYYIYETNVCTSAFTQLNSKVTCFCLCLISIKVLLHSIIQLPCHSKVTQLIFQSIVTLYTYISQQSNFGGSSWTFDHIRGEYYYHNYLSSQPDLNYRHPPVLKEIDVSQQVSHSNIYLLHQKSLKTFTEM